MPAVKATIRAFRKTGAHVILVGPAPEYLAALPRLEFISLIKSDPGITVRAQDNRVRATNDALKRMAHSEGIPYVSLLDALCPGNTCRTYASSDVPLMLDTDHFSLAGSQLIAPLLISAMDSNGGNVSSSASYGATGNSEP